MKIYYVYTLKDPRTNEVFYVGKGIANRMHEHKADLSRKGLRIKEINDAGYNLNASEFMNNLSEEEACLLEAELITLLGTVETGGSLLNRVVPSGRRSTNKPLLNTPLGTAEKAQISLDMMKTAVTEFIHANSKEGVKNEDIANHLGLQSIHLGASRNYLTYSILGLLLKENKIKKTKDKRYVTKLKL